MLRAWSEIHNVAKVSSHRADLVDVQVWREIDKVNLSSFTPAMHADSQ